MIQLNFLEGHESSLFKPVPVEQLLFWDESFNPIKVRKDRRGNVSEAVTFFQSLQQHEINTYCSYWESVRPKNDSEFFQRWLFAFMSVHTAWKANIVGYLAIKDWWVWMNKPELLLHLIDTSRVGMQHNRVKYISTFAQQYWSDPSSYRQERTTHNWQQHRDALQGKTLGLGPAKTSFALEMCYPTTAKITCLDTHLFQVWGLDQSTDLRKYNSLENCWVDLCAMYNVPPYIARCIYWDRKQNKQDSRYWSLVLEQ
jgi:hypothetical protein